MRPNLQERGQALILIALAAVGLFAFAALAIDGSRTFSNKRHAQNAADTAVLTAALVQARTGNFADAILAAQERAKSNGFDDVDPNTEVAVNLCSDQYTDPVTNTLVYIDCPGLPAGAQRSEYIRVRITSEIPATFGRVIGRQTLQSAVEAIAHVAGSSSTGSFPQDAVVALDKTGCAICSNGNGGLEVHGSGVFSNSTNVDCSNKNSSMTFWTNYDPFSEQGFTIPSADPNSFCLRGTTMLASGSGGFKTGVQIDPHYNVPEPSITCTGPAAADSGNPNDPAGAIVHQGWHNSLVSLPSGNWTFESGPHCFANGLNINANTVVANNVSFLFQGPGNNEFRIAGNDFTCNNMLVFVAVGTGIHFSGSGDVTCTGVTFYMKTGDVNSIGNPNIHLKASAGGSAYQGLLIYLPDSNPSPLKIGGTADNELTGSIIAPTSVITLNGTSSSNGFDTQIIGKRILLDGTSNTLIKYNPANQYNPPAAPTIQLTE